MVVYKDIITNDKLLSDSYNLKEVGGVAYEVDCTRIGLTESGVEVDISAAEDTEIKVVHAFGLQRSINWEKKAYFHYLSSYFKVLTGKLREKGRSEEEIQQFVSGAASYSKDKVYPDFKNYEFYTGESGDLNGMVVLHNVREDGVTEYLTFWKHGLDEMEE